jgi:hypothetical protein
MAGGVGGCVESLRRSFIFGDPKRLKECKGDHRKEGMVVKSGP